MQILLNDLFYKGISFSISFYDPVGDYNSNPVGWKANREEFFVTKGKWEIEVVYSDSVVIKIPTTKGYNYKCISYRFITDINWSE